MRLDGSGPRRLWLGALAWRAVAAPVVTLLSDAPSTTSAIAGAIAELSRAGDLLVLAGEMGAGKTAFAQGFAAALGVTEPVTSPTFTLVHSYDTGRITLHHADVYRLDRMAEVADLALGELLESDGIVLVEWGDVVARALGDHLEVRLDAPDFERPELRVVTLAPSGGAWASRWDRLVRALAEWQADG